MNFLQFFSPSQKFSSVKEVLRIIYGPTIETKLSVSRTTDGRPDNISCWICLCSVTLTCDIMTDAVQTNVKMWSRWSRSAEQRVLLQSSAAKQPEPEVKVGIFIFNASGTLTFSFHLIYIEFLRGSIKSHLNLQLVHIYGVCCMKYWM